jgi:hypothetical protein
MTERGFLEINYMAWQMPLHEIIISGFRFDIQRQQ